ncbi:MAG: rhomboid family intramembrane serine protease [Phycisphaerae bacterium]|nr:rhomboid family intramembrane serine protease [Phycisphaerae bacterium]
MSDFQQRLQVELPAPSKLFTCAVVFSLAFLIIGFALLHYAPQFTTNNLALSTQGVFSGKVWQLVTYPFVEGCTWNLIFGFWVLLFAGSAVERQWRTRGYVALWLVVSIVCGLAWLLVSALWRPYVGGGVSACSYGLIAAFGMLYRRVRFYALFCTVEGQYLAMIMIGMGIVLSIAQPVTLVWVGGALVAYLYVHARWRLGSRPRAFREPKGGGGFVDID